MWVIINFLVTFGGIFITSYFFYTSTNWKQLSDKYKNTERLEASFLLTQEIVYINKVAINRFNVGVSNAGLFLSFSSLMNFFFPSILIPWEEIYSMQDVSNSRTGYYIFQLGNPKIASLQLSSNTIEKIHRNYGEPIFSNELGELS